MAQRLGIACDLEVRKWELEQEYKNTRGWRSTAPFVNRKDAEDWVENKAKELNCKVVKPGKPAKGKKVQWFGFLFEHDGPK